MGLMQVYDQEGLGTPIMWWLSTFLSAVYIHCTLLKFTRPFPLMQKWARSRNKTKSLTSRLNSPASLSHITHTDRTYREHLILHLIITISTLLPISTPLSSSRGSQLRHSSSSSTTWRWEGENGGTVVYRMMCFGRISFNTLYAKRQYIGARDVCM